jgi:hypothetical protein
MKERAMGKREGAGKKPNKLPVEFGKAFRKAADDALAVLVDMARNGSSQAARDRAVKELKQRGHIA